MKTTTMAVLLHRSSRTHTHHYDIWILDFVSIFIDVSMPSNIWRVKAKNVEFLFIGGVVTCSPCVCAHGSIDGMRVCFLSLFLLPFRPLVHISFYYLSIFDVLLLLHHIFMSDINVCIRLNIHTTIIAFIHFFGWFSHTHKTKPI